MSIIPKNFCVKCGQKINKVFFKGLDSREPDYVEFDNGVYCRECGREEVKRRREK